MLQPANDHNDMLAWHVMSAAYEIYKDGSIKIVDLILTKQMIVCEVLQVLVLPLCGFIMLEFTLNTNNLKYILQEEFISLLLKQGYLIIVQPVWSDPNANNHFLSNSSSTKGNWHWCYWRFRSFFTMLDCLRSLWAIYNPTVTFVE